MKNLFEADRSKEVLDRIDHLTPDAPRLWGSMSSAQMLAHCAVGVETSTGAQKPPRALVGRFLGPIIKPLVLRNDQPMRKNSPTAPIFIIEGDRNFQTEKARLRGLVDQFCVAGPACCTTHPHALFGRLSPKEWAILMYKHLDHHLRQFGV